MSGTATNMLTRDLGAHSGRKSDRLRQARAHFGERVARLQLPDMSEQRKEQRRDVLCLLYEEEMRHLVESGLQARDIPIVSKPIIAMVSRIFGRLHAMEWVSVQPQDGPVGVVVNLQHKYGMSKGSVQQGTMTPQNFSPYYGTDYIDGEPVVTGDGVNYGGADGQRLNYQLSFFPVFKYDSTLPVGRRLIIQELDADGVVIQDARDNGAGGFSFYVGGTLQNPTNGTGSINYGTGLISNFRFQQPPAADDVSKAFYCYNMESSALRPGFIIDPTLTTVTATERGYLNTWSSASEQKLRSALGLDADKLFSDVMGSHASLEVDHGIFMALRGAATYSENWDATVPDNGVSQHDHFASMLTVIDLVSASIQGSVRSGIPNRLLCSPKTVRYFRNTARFKSSVLSTVNPVVGGDLGVYMVGILDDRYMLYVDPYYPDDEILVGYRGATDIEAGAHFAPWIPLMFSDTWLDVRTWDKHKGMRGMDSFTVTRGDFYGKVVVTHT